MNHWLVKSEPETYSWQDFLKDRSAPWDGVRNYQARNNLRKMKKGDQVFFYHSGEERKSHDPFKTGRVVIGMAQVSREFYPDPTTEDHRWVAVDLVPVRSLRHSVPLKDIKSDPKLKNVALVKQSRLSVIPLTPSEFNRILSLGNG